MWKILHFDLLLDFLRDLLSDLVLTYFAVLRLVRQLGAQGFLKRRLRSRLGVFALRSRSPSTRVPSGSGQKVPQKKCFSREFGGPS